MTQELKVRKYYTFTDEVLVENERTINNPVKRSVSLAVIKNPYAGIYKEDLSKLYDYGAILGKELSERAVEHLNVSVNETESYGKAAIVGSDGEVEHGHAILHPKIGAPFRESMGGAEHSKAVIPSTTKLGLMGSTIDIPVHFKNSEWVLSHVDTITVTIPDAPMQDEILIGVAITNSGRALSRLPGLSKEEAAKK